MTKIIAPYGYTKAGKIRKHVVKESIKTVKKLTQAEILDLNAEDVIKMISDGNSYDIITKKYRVCREALALFISASDYSARAREAQKSFADSAAEKAEKALLAIKPGDTQATITRQRELASHYRWVAAKKNPSGYGDNARLQAELKNTTGTSTWLSDALIDIDKNK